MIKKILVVVVLVNISFASFYKEGNIVRDNKTFLQWQDNRDAMLNLSTWSEAVIYCNKLRLDGFNDFRLPNKKELFTIVDNSKYNPRIKSNIFKNISSGFYWISDNNVKNISIDYSVAFGPRNSNSLGKNGKKYVRCVRN